MKWCNPDISTNNQDNNFEDMIKHDMGTEINSSQARRREAGSELGEVRSQEAGLEGGEASRREAGSLSCKWISGNSLWVNITAERVVNKDPFNIINVNIIVMISLLTLHYWI